MNSSNKKEYYKCLQTNYESPAYDLLNTAYWRKIDNLSNYPKPLPKVWVPGLDANLYDNGSYGVTASPIPANITHTFILRTECSEAAECDVIIDWGDGNFSQLSQGINDPSVDEFLSNGQFKLSHTYDLAEGEHSKYIIKIYGTKYYGLQSYNSNNNLICRILDRDLPIASNCTHIASMCQGAKYLTSVNIPTYGYKNLLSNIRNMYNIFQSCINLREVNGLSNIPSLNNNAPVMFGTCRNLTSMNYKLPFYMKTINSVFTNNYNLSMDIMTLLPEKGFFSVDTVDCGNAFLNCKSLAMGSVSYSQYDLETGETILNNKGQTTTITELITQDLYDTQLSLKNTGKPNHFDAIINALNINSKKLGNILWNDNTINWKNTSTCFSTCSDLIRTYVPKSWGGTASDDIIDDNLSYDEIEINTLLSNKADLVSGKVPESQLPDLLKLGETSTTAYSGSAGTQLAAYVMNNLKVRIEDINDDLSNTPQLVSRINSRKIYTK
jgi:hypothetical protein